MNAQHAVVWIDHLLAKVFFFDREGAASCTNWRRRCRTIRRTTLSD